MNPFRKLRFVAATLLLSVSLGSVAQAQTDEERAGARALARQGAAAFKEGRWEDAVRFFDKAESFVHAPPHLVFSARAHIELGQLVEARELLLRVKNEGLADTAPPAFHAAKEQAVQILPTLAPRIPQLTVNIEGAGDAELVIDVDGKKMQQVFVGVPRAVNPGKHEVSAIGDGLRGGPLSIEIAEGETKGVTLQLKKDATAKLPGAAPEPAEGPEPAEPAAAAQTGGDVGADEPPGAEEAGGPNWPMYAAFGVGGVGLVLGSVFAASSASSRSDADDLETECNAQPNGCREGDPLATQIAEADDSAGTAQTLSLVSYIVGGVGVAAGVTLLIVDLTGDDASADLDGVRVTPVIGLGSAGVRGTF